MAKNNSKGFSIKKTIGICLIVLGVLVFLFSLFPSALVIGNFFLGVLGVLTYPLCLFLVLLGTALIMNLSYTFSKKFTFYLAVAILSLLCLAHTIFTSKMLNSTYVSFKDMGGYLKACYNMENGITVGGVLLGIVVFFVRALLKLGGAYVVFAILATVFIGLIVDYLIYNKARKRKEIKNRQDIERRLEETKPYGEDEGYSFSVKNPEKVPSLFEGFEGSETASDEPSLFETTTNDEEPSPAFGFDQNQSLFTEKTEPEKVVTEKDYAKNVLFGDREEAKPEENVEPRSAHDILFGDGPAVPNIFDRSSDDRDAWKRQYASQTLSYDENLPKTEEPSIEPTEETDTGLVKTSWGEYRPTKSFEGRDVRRRDEGLGIYQSQPAEESSILPADNGRDRGVDRTERVDRSDRLDRVNRDRADRVDRTDRLNADRTDRISRDRLDRRGLDSEKTTLSDFSLKAEENKTEEFPSRLSDRRAGGDILANATSLGIEAKPVNNFASVLDGRDRLGEREKPQSEVREKPQNDFAKQLNQKYVAPPTDLLNVVKEEHVDYSEEYKQKSEILEKTLNDFKISAKVINVVRGPKVTRYEMSMPSGIPVSRVLAYDKDMSMNLATRSGVRIEAPIPGKNAFGVEVENAKASMVGLRELVESPEFKNFKGPLPVAIGKNISGEVIIKSLPKMVHLLVAGSTGSGKSVFLHSLIMSLMYKHSPEELRFIMVDPKRVEFSRYNKMPHMMLPEIVSDCSKAVSALGWAVKEMERRYQLLMDNECQKLEQFNECPAVKEGREKKLPYLVIVIDELAELMGIAKKDVEGKIQRITQLGRAAGIHMVVATQRPSTDVVTGTIKNNLPTRVAFSLSSAIDSMTVINQGGAEKLLGQGDMLLSAQDSNQLVRLQAAFVSDEEIRKTLIFIKEHNPSVYDEEVQKEIYAEPEKDEDDDGDEGEGGGDDKMDEYMPQALKLVMKNGKASISMIQRRFSVGYARAARIIDQMEVHGFIDGGIGNKPRDVKITIEEYNQLFGDYDAE